MIEDFFQQPILNTPYDYPARHWELDEFGQPTGRIVDSRRRVSLESPVPRPQGQKQRQLNLAVADGDGQEYDILSHINEVRGAVDEWRRLESPADWLVTPETGRLLQYWRSHDFQSVRPFFCQVEAAETLIWLTEVVPKLGKNAAGRAIQKHLERANAEANPELSRVALKLATGAGKTTVMAMIIAWQTINAVRRPASINFSQGFLIVTPGITIKDRLRVLQPNDPDNYYRNRELVPTDLLPDVQKAKIVITNYHAFKLRETLETNKVGRALLQGRGPALITTETEGQMIRRVMDSLMRLKRIMVLNDEAHHCYREKPQNTEVEGLKGDEKKEAQENNEAARLWINGLEAVNRTLSGNRAPSVRQVIDLSATPYFLSGSGYKEGSLFPWTVSDFSLLDAIEAGIVKLPRIPIADNVAGADMPKLRNLWEHIGKRMPKSGRAKSDDLDPQKLPNELLTALDALFGHYRKTFEAWQEEGIEVPPVFIVVTNNTSTSKLIYDYIAGYEKVTESGTVNVPGHFDLFQNFDAKGNRLPRPNTLLIDSHQLESGDALDKNFREAAADEINRFRREIRERTGDIHAAESISDQDLLREVMNTVGKVGRLGESVRCVVSVSMLTEGWDANTVTHILGVRAFGTQLLCEQVVGRGLRRQSYDANDDGKFSVEYADILGIPFAFTARPVEAKPQRPRKTTQIEALSPMRDPLEIRFPRVEGYQARLPDDQLNAKFTDDSTLKLTPELVGPGVTRNKGVVGDTVDLNLEHLENSRTTSIAAYIAKELLFRHFQDEDGVPKSYLFPQLWRIASEWLAAGHLQCVGGTKPAQVIYPELLGMAAQRIRSAIALASAADKRVFAVLDSYNPVGSSRHVHFATTKRDIWTTDPRRCHINKIALDSTWEKEFCRVAESHERVRAYVKNQGLGLEIPYQILGRKHRYIPDFIVRIDDGREDLLNLVVEIKGYRNEHAKEKAMTIQSFWVPGVNNLGTFGRWEFAEFRDVNTIEAEFKRIIEDFVTKAASDIAAAS